MWRGDGWPIQNDELGYVCSGGVSHSLQAAGLLPAGVDPDSVTPTNLSKPPFAGSLFGPMVRLQE